MRKLNPEDKHLNLNLLRPILKEELSAIMSDAVHQIKEALQIFHDKLDTKLDILENNLSNDISGLRQDLHQTKVELLSEIRSSSQKHDVMAPSKKSLMNFSGMLKPNTTKFNPDKIRDYIEYYSE